MVDAMACQLHAGRFGFEPATGALEPLAGCRTTVLPPASTTAGATARRASRSAPWPSRPIRSPEWRAVPLRCRAPAARHGLGPGDGLAFSPESRTLYHSGSHASVQIVWAWAPDPAGGAISDRRVFTTTHRVAGRPAGAAVEAGGCHWVAADEGWRQIRYTSQARIDRIIRLPVERPIMLASGGREGDTSS